ASNRSDNTTEAITAPCERDGTYMVDPPEVMEERCLIYRKDRATTQAARKGRRRVVPDAKIGAMSAGRNCSGRWASSFLAVVALPVTVFAQAPTARASVGEIDSHLRFLSSDLLEGRAPATRGGQLAAEYIASTLESEGVQPGWRGSY